jgi:hypothetical protein
LTEYSDLSEVETKETETVVVMVKTVKMAEVTETVVEVMTTAAVMVKTVAITVKMVAAVGTAKTVEVTETMAEITNRKGSGRWHIRGNTGSLSSISEVRIMCNITAQHSLSVYQRLY